MQRLYGPYRIIYYPNDTVTYVDVWKQAGPHWLHASASRGHWRYLLRKHGGIPKAAAALFAEYGRDEW